jgi:peptidoglycan/LPS O-acetylase OafA/YrhL
VLLVPLWSLSTEFYSNILQILLRLTGSIRKIFLVILFGALPIILSGVYFYFNLDWTKPSLWLFGFGRALIGFNVGQVMWFCREKCADFTWFRSLLFSVTGFAMSVSAWLFTKNFILIPIYFSFGFLVLAFSQIRNPDGNSRLLVILKVLGETSFPIYLFHTLFLKLIAPVFTTSSLIHFLSFYVFILAFSFIAIRFL